MLQRIKRKLDDMRTIKALAEAAERHANAAGEREPGPEHFLLAAFDLPDGLARRAFARLGVDPAGIQNAIAAQHSAALASTGIAPTVLATPAPLPPATGIYRAKGSMQAVMQQLAAWPRATPSEPLTGAHVLAVIASSAQGTAARTLRTLGLDGERVGAAARAEIAGYRAV